MWENIIKKLKKFRIKVRLKSKHFLSDLKQNYIYGWIALVITIAFAVVWGVNRIYPFGKHSLIIVDGVHQYIPFFAEYYEKIKNGESLFYSFHVGMGNNFLSLFFGCAVSSFLCRLFSSCGEQRAALELRCMSFSLW